jgi:glucokinase
MASVIGLDIGGTKLRAGVVEDNGEVHDVAVSSTNAVDGAEAILGRVHDILDGLLRIAPEVEAIGIGATGRVDTSTGQIVGSTDMLPGWRGVALGDIVRGWFGLPVAVDNDGNAAAIGEAWAGAARDAANFVLLTLGTGVGGALVHEGRPIRGWSYRAGELGHMILYPDGRLCECGARGCLERYASGPSLLARANESAGAVRYRSPASVLVAATAGDPVARAATDAVTADLATALWSLANIYDPQLFVLGGGLTEGLCAAWPDWPARLRARAGLACPVVRAELGADAVVVGAARLHIAPGRPPSGASPAGSVR